MSNLKRQPINDRSGYDYDERVRISAKSDNKCCHCGREVYWGYGATVDHFVPLSEGGVDRDYNMIMLCHDCNQEKKSKIYEPTTYLKYLKKEHKDKLKDYFKSYIRSFDFFNKRNVMACDEYIYSFYVDLQRNGFRKTKKNQRRSPMLFQVKLKRATYEDKEMVTEYYTKYLKKHGHFESDESAACDVELILRYGCIYYVIKNNEINALCFVTIEKESGKFLLDGYSVNHAVSILLMPYYSTTTSYNMARLLSQEIPDTIFHEQNLDAICTKIRTFDSEKLFYSNIYGQSSRDYICHDAPFLIHPVAVYNKEVDENNAKRVDDFFKKNHPDCEAIKRDIEELYGGAYTPDDPPLIYRLFDGDYFQTPDVIASHLVKAEMNKEHEESKKES